MSGRSNLASRMQPIEISTALTADDWRAYAAACNQQLQGKSQPLPRRILWFVVIMAVSAVAVHELRMRAGTIHWSSMAFGAFALFAIFWVQHWRLRRRAIPESDGALLGPCTLRFDGEGVHSLKRLSRTSYGWQSIRYISATPEHLFLWVDRCAAIMVPVRALPVGFSAAEFQALLQHSCHESRGEPTAHLDPAFSHVPVVHAATVQSTAPTPLPEFLGAMARLLMLRAPASTALNPSDRALAGCIAVYIGAWLLSDWATSAAHASFDWFGILPLSWHVVGILLVAYVFAHGAEPRLSFRQTFAMVLALIPWYALAWAAAGWLPDAAWLIALVAILHINGSLLRGVQSLTGRLQGGAWLLSLCVMCGALWAGTQTYSNPRFWYGDESEAIDSSEAEDYLQRQAAAEALLYRQTSMIDAEVARMQRPQALAAAGFFVGLGGVGEQRVFAGEIALAQQVMAQQFATGMRSITLVNDQRNLEAHPLASLSGLQHALTRIAARMDLDRDVLFLALSSHGSRDGELSVSNGTLPLNDLSAADLAQALRVAGIRRKVVIVSACYSGTFIEPLRDSDTIIITASAADRNSFGCADDRDLTYFGEAFYRDALQHTSNLRRAFELAKAEIARRETQESKRASNPQAYFGTQLEEYLHGWPSAAPTELSAHQLSLK
jgi:hypothetical protein